MRINSRGFSLVEVLVAVGMMGGLSLLFMRFSSNVSQTQMWMENSQEKLNLRSYIQMILREPKFCRVSLAGSGALGIPDNPVIFKKVDIDEIGNEGLDISLYYSDPSGVQRGLKRFNGMNNPGDDEDRSFSGKLKIKTLKLIMNNPPLVNYTESTSHTDFGVIRAEIIERLSKDTERISFMEFPLKIWMKTNSLGESTILGCSDSEITGLDFSEYQRYTIVVPQNGFGTELAIDFAYCGLSMVASGGVFGQGEDYCKVTNVGRNWTLTGHRGADAQSITCEMTCAR